MPSSDTTSAPGIACYQVLRLRGRTEPETAEEPVAVEEPLELHVNGRPFAVLMRTPGHDEELAAGYLLTEGVIAHREQIASIELGNAVERAGAEGQKSNVARVWLEGSDAKMLRALTRRTATGSSCGSCGKESIQQVHRNFPPLRAGGSEVTAPVLQSLPTALAEHQEVFRCTGGLHGVALFESDGRTVVLREDVGRHNAVDKVLGRALLDELLPKETGVLFVSGRISFEIMQKALAARIRTIAGISAPTSLAVEFARASQQTLVGFVREGRATVYAGALAG